MLLGRLEVRDLPSQHYIMKKFLQYLACSILASVIICGAAVVVVVFTAWALGVSI